MLCAYRYGIVGGVSTQFLLRQAALREAGIDCHLFFAQDNGLKAVLADRSTASFGSEVSLRRLIRKLRPDVGVVVDSPELLAPMQGRGKKLRVYLDVHTTTALGLSYLHDLSLRRVAGVLVPTQYSAGLVRKRLPAVDPVVVPNLIDAEMGPDRSKQCPPEGLRPEFLWVGKLDHHKNWRMALVWARLINELFHEFRLTMVGGYTAPDPRVDEFMALADELDLSDRLRWVDRIDNAALPRLFRQSARSGGAMLVTSRDESFGMAVAEALLCGCPVITNDLPVFHEVFPDSPLLQRVDVWDPSMFLEAVRRLPTVRSDAAVRSVREHLVGHYGPEAFLAAMQPILEAGDHV